MPKRKYRRCPKCKHKLKEGEELYVEQKYSTTIMTEMNINGEIEDNIDTIASGYNLLDDFISNMLMIEGKPKILGCEHCI